MKKEGPECKMVIYKQEVSEVLNMHILMLATLKKMPV